MAKGRYIDKEKIARQRMYAAAYAFWVEATDTDLPVKTGRVYEDMCSKFGISRSLAWKIVKNKGVYGLPRPVVKKRRKEAQDE